MDVTNFIPWLLLAGTLAFIMIAPLLSEAVPDYDPARIRKRGRRKR
jgi:hypothetical protein